MPVQYDVKHIGKNIKHIRKEILKISQEKLSEMADVSTETISNIERGEVEPSIKTLIGIANSTAHSMDSLCKKNEDETMP